MNIEHDLESTQESKKQSLTRKFYYFIKNPIEMISSKINQESEDEIEELDDVWTIIAISNVLSIFILIVEIMLNRCF